MAKSRADQMVDRLRSMQAAAPDIEASAIVSVDGLIMASALQQGVEEDRVSAMSAAMLSLGERISGELGRGSLEQVYIKGDTGAIVLTSVGSEAVLTALKAGSQIRPYISRDAPCRRRYRQAGRMKTKKIHYSSRITIPNGEGLTALPISFVLRPFQSIFFNIERFLY